MTVVPPAITFPKAQPVARGCGERTPGGLYIECGLSPVGRPFDDFLVDPPLPLLPGLDATTLANKPRFIRDPADGTAHLVIWIGAEHYPYVSDYIEEARRFGISRKLSPSVLRQQEATGLSLASRMLLVHPYVINTRWQSQRPPYQCRKGVSGHALPAAPDDGEGAAGAGASGGGATQPGTGTITPIVPIAPIVPVATAPSTPQLDDTPLARDHDHGSNHAHDHLVGALVVHPSLPRAAAVGDGTEPAADHTGPCLFKDWELVPRRAAAIETDPLDGRPRMDPRTGEPRYREFWLGGRLFCRRRIGSTEYTFAPTFESSDGNGGDVEGLDPGIFGAFPITGFALMNGGGDEGVRQQTARVLQDLWERVGVPWYATDQ